MCRTINKYLSILIYLLTLLSLFVIPVSASAYYSEENGSASTIVNWGSPYQLVGEYPTYKGHILKLGVKCVIYGSGTAKGSMSVMGRAVSNGWVVGTLRWYMKGYLRAPFVNLGSGSAWITIKFQAKDMTTGGVIEKILFHENADPFTGNDYDGEYEGIMDISLYQDHLYEFVLYAEVYADAVGIATGISDFAGVLYPSENPRIEWRYMDVPNIGANGGFGCPFVSTWNGTHYVLDNNLIPAAEYSNRSDVTDYYLLQQPLIRDDGKYSLLIWDLDKHSYLDKVQLLAVDHESDVNIALTPDGEILTYKNPAAPVNAVSKNGSDITNVLSSVDGNYYESYAGDYLVVDFGGLDVAEGAKLVLRTDMYCEPIGCKESIHVQVLNATEQWIDVASFIPRVYWSTDILDLSNYLPDINSETKVRLYFTATHKIDYVGLDTSKHGEYETFYAKLATANHSQLGNVKGLFENSDNQYVELLPGEQVMVRFILPQNTRQKRDFIIILEGHYFKIS